jgi:hypothetical protein
LSAVATALGRASRYRLTTTTQRKKRVAVFWAMGGISTPTPIATGGAVIQRGRARVRNKI